MLIVTRPLEQAQSWLAELSAAGVEADALPLMSIGPAQDPAAVEAARAGLAHWDGLVFVSPNAVSHFFGPQPTPWPQTTWAAAPGPGTAQALMERGVPPSRILQPPADAAQFDSESLWPVMAEHAWSGRSVLIVRGEGGREWLGERLKEAGARVQTLSAYRRQAPQLTASQQALLQQSLQRPQDIVWLFSSSEAVAHLPVLAEGLLGSREAVGHWASNVLALATHPRIQAEVQRLGFVRAALCRPDLSSVVGAYNRAHREP